jgi:CDP-diacylglycerol--serine O-phosphatidyltransferase
VISTLHGNYGIAAVAIGIAVVLDGIDGRLARMTGSTSDFGLQLDSLADVISFGIAPAVLVYSWGLEDFGNFARFSAFVFLICGAMRLARFNAQVQEMKHFAGLPIPAGAGMIAATVHFFQVPPESQLFKVGLVVMTYALSFLMISTIRYPSLKQLNLSRGKSHLNILLLAILVAGVVWYSQQVLILIASIYCFSGLSTRVYQFLKYRLRESKALKTEEAESD